MNDQRKPRGFYIGNCLQRIAWAADLSGVSAADAFQTMGAVIDAYGSENAPAIHAALRDVVSDMEARVPRTLSATPAPSTETPKQ